MLHQSDADWRLLVVDDRYPDRAPGEWVRGLDDARITYTRNEANLGVSGNFRRCIELAPSGPYVTMMGCDDLLLEGYVERMHELYRRHPVMPRMCNRGSVSSTTQALGRSCPLPTA